MKKVLSLILSIVMLFSVTAGMNFSAYAAATVYESESNNVFSTADSFSIGAAICGNSNNNDPDFFKFTLSKGGKVSFHIEAYVDKNEGNDSQIWLFNSSCNEVEDGTNHLVFYDDNWGYDIGDEEFMLQPGTYYLKMQVFQDNSAGYRIESKFSASNQTFKEPDAYPSNSHPITFGNTVYGQIDTYFEDFDRNSWDRDYDVYKFSVSSKSTINLHYTMKRNPYGHGVFTVQIFDSSMSDDIAKSTNDGKDSNASKTISKTLNKGTYYIAVTGDPRDMITYSLKIGYKVSKPSTLKVSTRNTTSLKLSWSKVSGASGYQLQCKSGDSYKTLTNTTSRSYTVKKLKAGTTYTFRVRTYKTISGKKYYSSWKTLTTPTKPSKPSIKAPSTNKKHQIIAKWKAVSKCTGYQVQYSKKKNFSSVIATKTVSGRTKTSYTGKNFTKGKTYYVRVRSYKTVNGKKYYSAWSSVKSIKCK